MERTREEKMSIANKILKQLGGHKFIVMTGAKDCLALDSGVRFRLPGGGGRAKNGINYVRVELDPNDTYSMAFFKCSKRANEKISGYSCVYFDKLQELFTQETGLETHL